MKKKVKMKGLDKVLRNLNKEIGKIQKLTKRGLYESALVIKGDSLELTPIQFGNLRNSCFIYVTDRGASPASARFEGDDSAIMASDHSASISEMKSVTDEPKGQYSAVVAYSAYYAFYVHEMPPTNNFNDGENHFLLKSIEKNRSRILKILKEEAKI